MLHSGLKSQGESGLRHAHTDTHLRPVVSTITAGSSPECVMQHGGLLERETDRKTTERLNSCARGL